MEEWCIMSQSYRCLLESLEDRRLLSVTIDSVTVQPSPMVRGTIATMTAQVTASVDDRVRSVMYFVDENGNGLRDRGEFLVGRSGNATTNFRVTKRVPAGSSLGPVNIAAIAKGALGAGDLSPTFTLSANVVDQAPTIKRLTIAPPQIQTDGTLKLIANGVSNKDGDRRIVKVEFWLDVNQDGLIDAGDDLVSGSADTSPAGGWKITTTADGAAPGVYHFLAQATDSDGSVSNIVSTIGTVI
jgi:hypothetical protein